MKWILILVATVAVAGLLDMYADRQPVVYQPLHVAQVSVY